MSDGFTDMLREELNMRKERYTRCDGTGDDGSRIFSKSEIARSGGYHTCDDCGGSGERRPKVSLDKGRGVPSKTKAGPASTLVVEKVYNPKTKRIDSLSRVTIVDDETGPPSSYRIAGRSEFEVDGEGAVTEYYLLVRD